MIEVAHTRGRWLRSDFAPPFGFRFRSAWRFPRREEYLHLLPECHDEPEEELTEVTAEIERLKTRDEQKKG